MTKLTPELKAQMVQNAKFLNRGTGKTTDQLSEHLEFLLIAYTDSVSLADALRYYGYISENQAIKMAKGLDWSFAKAGA